MKLIIIEGSAYKVSEKEFTEIKKLEAKLKDSSVAADHKLFFEHEDVLSKHLDENKANYKYLGEIWFQYQR